MSRASIKPTPIINNKKEYFTQQDNSRLEKVLADYSIDSDINQDEDFLYVELDSFYDMVNLGENTSKSKIVLDTANLAPVYDTIDPIWVYTSSVNKNTGSISTYDEIGRIKSMKAQNATAPNISANTLSSGDRVCFTIAELRAQSCIYDTTVKYHFIGKARTTDNPMNVSFYNFCRGLFLFNLPITQLSTLTLQMYSFSSKLILPRQIRYGIPVSGSNPMAINFTTAHYFTNATTIKISGFTSDNSVVDAAVNTTHTLTVVSSTQITVPVDISAVTISSANVITNYERFRIIFPIEFEYFSDS